MADIDSTSIRNRNVIHLRHWQRHRQPDQPIEKLNGRDYRNLRDLIHTNSRAFHMKESVVFAIWRSLRKATDTPAPYPFLVSDLPLLAEELKRIHGITSRFSQFSMKMESVLIKRLLRDSEDESEVMAFIKDEYEKFLHQWKKDRDQYEDSCFNGKLSTMKAREVISAHWDYSECAEIQDDES